MTSATPTTPSATSTTELVQSAAKMYYLIHTPHHPRPYLSALSFVANDFAKWGCRVTCHAKSSAYITEVRYQETRNRPASRRIELMEVWAKEVLARKQQRQQATINPAVFTEARQERASAFVQDFVSGLSTMESPVTAPKPLQSDPFPLPKYPLALVAKYTRLIHRCAYTSCATPPVWADSDIYIVDRIALEFRHEKTLERGQLSVALTEAISKGNGRMGRVEKCGLTGMTKVFMWIDVGDLTARESKEVDDPVPVYAQGDWVWPPSYESAEAVELM